MHLNLLNQTVIVKSAIEGDGHRSINPRFGSCYPVNGDLFKFSTHHDPTESVFVERVDLGRLLGGIPQDLRGLAHGGYEKPDLDQLNQHLGVDLTTNEPLLIADDESIGDWLTGLFLLWKKLLGITSLSRNEVELTHDETHLFIDANQSVLFKGQISVRFN